MELPGLVNTLEHSRPGGQRCMRRLSLAGQATHWDFILRDSAGVGEIAYALWKNDPAGSMMSDSRGV